MMNEDMTSEQASEGVDLRRLFFLLLQWIWLVILVAVLAGGAAYFISRQMTPVYQTSTLLLVSSPAQNGAGSNMVVNNIYATNTYAQMLNNQPVLQQIIDELNLPLTPKKLKAAIDVTVITNTQMLRVTVEDTDPQRAADIANKLGKVFGQRIQDLQGQRYAVSKSDLLKQMATMEAQINQTSQDLQVAKDLQATQEMKPTQVSQSDQTPVPTPVSEERIRLEANLTQYRTIYNNLVTSYQQVQLAEAQTNDTVTQVEPASVPDAPVRPRSLLNGLLAAMVGAMVTAGAVVGIDILDDTIKDPDELSQRTGLPIVGVIPFTKTEEKGLVTQLEPRSPISEAYRELRTNLQFSDAARKLDRIVVTSPTPADGKTTVASNLAVILAQSGRKVALVEADLRRPMVHNMFNLASKPGLTGLFVKQVELAAAAQTVGVDNLVVIPSGVLPPNPAETLGSERMKDLLDEIQEMSEVLILDTPPQLTVTDSAVLIPCTDGVLLVVRVGQTHVSAVVQAVSSLRRLGANVIGLVINGVKFNNSRYGYYFRSKYYSGDYYSESYDSDEKKDKRKKRAVRRDAP